MRLAPTAMALLVGMLLGLAPLPLRADEHELVRQAQVGPVQAIVGDDHGFLWVGTQAGLYRYDGRRLLARGPSAVSEPMDRFVRRAAVAADGAVWIATGRLNVLADSAGGARLARASGAQRLFRIAPGRPESEASVKGLPGSLVLALAPDERGGVWVGTDAGLGHVGAALEVRPVPAFARLAVYALAFDPGKARLAVGTSGGLSWLEAGVRHDTELREPVVAVAIDSHDASFWAATTTALVRGRDGQRAAFPAAEASPAIAVTRNGVWTGGMMGLRRAERTGPLTLVAESPQDWVNALFVDRDEQLWIGYRTSGLAVRRRIELQNVGAPEGLLGNVAFATLVTRNGALWATTDRGVVRFEHGAWTGFAYGKEVPSHALRSMAEAPDGAVWFTNGRLGLVRHSGGVFRAFAKADGVVGDDTRAVAFTPDGDLWASWTEGGLTRYPGGRVSTTSVTLTTREGLCDGEISRLLPARGRGLWAAGPGGLSLISATGTARCLSGHGRPLPQVGVSAIAAGADGTSWVALDGGGGVVALDGERVVRTLRPAAGLPVAEVFELVLDEAGNLWLSGPGGIHVVPADQLGNPAARARTYDAASGMRSQECIATFHPGLAIDRRGWAWAPTLAGLTAVAPPGPAPHAKLVIEEALAAGHAVAPEALVFPRGGGDLVLSVVVPHLASPHRVRVRHRLSSLEEPWQTASPDGAIRYPRLGPGAYALELQVEDDLGRGSGPPSTLSFSIPRPLWQTWPFAVLTAAGLGALFWALHAVRVRRIQARHAALVEERARIARDLHDGLAQGYGSVRLQLDAIRLAGSSRDLDGRLEGIKRTLDEWQQQARRAIWDIRTTDEPGITVGALLRRVVSRAPRPDSVAVKLDVEGANHPLSPDVAQELSMIVGEALANVFRHAHATRVDVTALGDEEGLHLVIEDDGKGISAAAAAGATGGVGLVGMRERLQRLGGRLTIGPRRNGAGTDVRAFIPTRTLAPGKMVRT